MNKGKGQINLYIINTWTWVNWCVLSTFQILGSTSTFIVSCFFKNRKGNCLIVNVIFRHKDKSTNTHILDFEMPCNTSSHISSCFEGHDTHWMNLQKIITKIYFWCAGNEYDYFGWFNYLVSYNTTSFEFIDVIYTLPLYLMQIISI